MVITCNIEWDNNMEGVSFSGHILTGRITLTNDKLEKTKGILLKVHGHEVTSWSEEKNHLLSGKLLRNSIKYKGCHTYIDSNTCLMGDKDSDEVYDFEPGIHTYTFASQIPANCPSSFEGQYGHVRYTVEVRVLQESSKNDLCFTKLLTILKIFDLNYDTPLLKMPINTEVERFCFGPCGYLPLKIDLYLRQSGFVPGQQIPIDVLFHTYHFVPDGELYLRLIMTVTYISQEPRKHFKQEAIIVSELNDKVVDMKDKDKCHYKLAVPATPPTCSSLYSLLQISYHVELQFKIKLLMIEQIVQAPVIIGNVPLLNVMEQQPTLYMGTNNMQNSKLLPWLTNDNIPKPIYQHAAHILKVNINKANEYNNDDGQEECDQEFSPKYTVFFLQNK